MKSTADSATRLCIWGLSLFLIAGSACHEAGAQDNSSSSSSAPASSAPQQNRKAASDEDDLSEITVVGYRAKASSTATGLDTPILDTPISIAVMTSEFLTDTGANRLVDELNTIAGVQTGGRLDEPTQVLVRGYYVTPQVDGFDLSGMGYGYFPGSTLGVSRVEVIKGPSSVFNGDIPPGGLVNIVYKQPSFTPNSYVEASGGSWNYASGELYSTGPLIEGKLAYLVDGFLKKGQGWVDWSEADEKSGIVALTFTPIDSVSLTVDYRSIEEHNQNAEWISTHTGFLTSGLPSTTNLFTWVPQVFGPNEPSLNAEAPSSNLPGGYRFNPFGPQNYTDHNTTMWEGKASVKVNDHIELREGVLRSNSWDPEVSIVAPYTAFLAPGPIGTVAPEYTGAAYLGFSNWEFESKTELIVRGDTGPINHTLLTGFEYEHSSFWYNYASAPGPANWNFFTNGPLMLQNYINEAYPTQNYAKYGPYDLGTVHAFYAVDQLSTFQDRLRFLLGARETQIFTPAGGGSYGANVVQTKLNNLTPEFGVLAKPFGSDSLFKDTSLFVNYARSYTPSGEFSGETGTVVPPQRGTGLELGVKTDWFHGAVASTVSIFRDDLNDVAEVDYIKTSQAHNGFDYYDLGESERSEGAEFDLIYTPSRNLQVATNYTWLPIAKTLAAPSTPQQVGVRFRGTPVHRGNINARYTFSQGVLNGAYIGGGLLAQSSTIGELTASWQYAVRVPGFLNASAFAGYSMKLAERTLDIRVNVKNAFDRGGFSWDPYAVEAPISYLLTVRLSQ
jgi:iron complex outermembrane recepter protein